MPFKSEKQRAWMYANKPEMAKQWEADTVDKNLPAKVKKVAKVPKIKKLKLPPGGRHQ